MRWLTGLTLSAGLLLGCTPSGPDPAAQEAARREQARSRLDERLQAIEARASQHPPDAVDLRAEVEVVRAEARAQDPPVDLGEGPDRVLAAIDEAFRSRVVEIVREARQRCEEAASREDYAAAVAALEPPPDIAGTDAERTLWHEQEARRTQQEAFLRYRSILEKVERLSAGRNYDMAIGAAESFGLIERFRGTPFGARLDAEIARLRERRASQGDEPAPEGLITFFGGERDDLTSFYYHPQATLVTVEEDAMVANARDIREPLLCLTKSDADAWGDFILSFEFQIVDGPELSVRLRALSTPDSRLQPHDQRFSRGAYPTGSWHSVEIRFTGQNVSISERGAAGGALTLTTRSDHGGFGFLIPPGGRVRFRNVRAQVLTYAQPSEEQPAETSGEEAGSGHDLFEDLMREGEGGGGGSGTGGDSGSGGGDGSPRR